jgi:hypothetical protein
LSFVIFHLSFFTIFHLLFLFAIFVVFRCSQACLNYNDQ